MAAYTFWGWETAFSVSEENVDRKVAGKAGLLSIAIAAGMFIFASVAFQRSLTADEFAEHGANALPYLTDKMFGGQGALVAYLAMLRVHPRLPPVQRHRRAASPWRWAAPASSASAGPGCTRSTTRPRSAPTSRWPRA
ncbi:amino acid permease [Yinghuangia aomiensis]